MRKLLAVFLMASGTAFCDSVDEERTKAETLFFQGKEAEYAVIIQRLSESGDIRSQEWYGQYLWRNGKKAEAEKWLKRAAESGDAAAQRRLGAFYLGISPSKPEEGRRWIELAAKQGDSRAKHLLSALDDTKLSPKIVDGKISTGDAADLGYLNLKKLLLSNPEFLECYRTAPENLESVFGPPAKACRKLALQEYGGSIPVSELLEFSRDVSGCIRSFALEKVNVTEKQLLECSKKIR